MLLKLLVRAIALLDEIQVSFGEGLHVLTGETGAGKSIVVDAVSLLLGGRADRDIIRAGCDRAYVEGVFDIAGNAPAQAWLSRQELDAEDGCVTLSREITLTGRSVCRVQGIAMPLGIVRELSALLLDLHGQHEHQSLLNEKYHLGCLDAMGDDKHQRLCADVAALCRQYRDAQSQYEDMHRASRSREERLALLRAQEAELTQAAIVPGEEEALAGELRLFRHAEKIGQALRTAYEAMYSGERGHSAVEFAREAMRAMGGVANLGEDLLRLSQRCEALYYEAEDVGLTLRDQMDNAGFDPERAAQVEERLDLLRRLSRKYGATAEDMLAKLAVIQDELRRFERMDDTLALLKERADAALSDYRNAAGRLTRSRLALAEAFEKRMEAQLAELNMRGTRFYVDFGAPSKRPAPTGDDTVSFLMAPNAGEDKKPLAKIASGGELSRVMLALKSLSAEREAIPAMIFDEIDAGISGRTAQVVAQKLWDIARFRQVICVSHLQQIAAMATRHYLIEKSGRDGRTRTDISELSGDMRTREIARMLSGVSDQSASAVNHASQMLREAAAYRNLPSD